MRHATVSLTGLAFVVASLLASHAVFAFDPADLDQVSRRFDALQFERDGTGLEAMVSHDLVYVNGRGERAGRDAFLGAVLAPVATLEPIEIDDREVHRYGDSAGAATGVATIRGTDADGKPFTVTFRYVDVFARVEGTWRVELVQVTMVPST